MKRILLISFLLLLSAIAVAQKDSILVSIDTINIKGKVIDENGNPVYNAIVLTENINKDHYFVQTKTNNAGLFSLNGISPKNIIRVRNNKLAIEEKLNGSRYLLIVLSQLSKLKLKGDEQHLAITAKRVDNRKMFSYKIKDTAVNYGFHPFGHYMPASFPGGLYKFYAFVQKNLVYPEKAIKNNVEGTIAVEFTIDVAGNLKDFLVTRDIGYGCAEEVLRVMKSSKKWNPAMNGTLVEQRVNLEIPFKLTD